MPTSVEVDQGGRPASDGANLRLGSTSTCRHTASTIPSPIQHPVVSSNDQTAAGIFMPAEGKRPKLKNVAPTQTPTPTPAAIEKPIPSKEFDPRMTATTPQFTLKSTPTLLSKQIRSSQPATPDNPSTPGSTPAANPGRFDPRKCELSKNGSEHEHPVSSKKSSSALERICLYCGKILSPNNRRTCDVTLNQHLDSRHCEFLRLNFAPGKFSEEAGELMICPYGDFRVSLSPGNTRKLLRHLSDIHPDHVVTCIFCERSCNMKDISDHVRCDAQDAFCYRGCFCKKCKNRFYSVDSFFSHLQTDHKVSKPNRASFTSHVKNLGKETDLFLLALYLHKYLASF